MTQTEFLRLTANATVQFYSNGVVVNNVTRDQMFEIFEMARKSFDPFYADPISKIYQLLSDWRHETKTERDKLMAAIDNLTAAVTKVSASIDAGVAEIAIRHATDTAVQQAADVLNAQAVPAGRSGRRSESDASTRAHPGTVTTTEGSAFREARSNFMTSDELQHEYEVARDTSLGALSGSGEPEPWMVKLAELEAREHVEALKEGHSKHGRG